MLAGTKTTENAGAERWVSGQQTILVIDDNEQILGYMDQILAGQYTVYKAASGEEGLELARKIQPDIIITDIVMQELSGIDLCRIIKEDLALGHIPVILLTGSPSPETRLQGVEGGADDYLTKPFEKEILLARIVSLLKSRDSLQKYFYNEITLQKNTGKISEEDRLFIDRCILIVKGHLDNDEFTIKTLSAEIGMSHSSLYKKIKSVSGGSVNAFIRFVRLRQVAELLINTEKNVNEAAMESGFNDLKYFREQFHKLFGVTPSEYIRKYRTTFSRNLNINRDLTQK
jgi:YesN/AraC family two-component response regulator